MAKKVTILSIDGGGIRGILPGVVLAYIESRLRAKEGDAVRLSDYFDLIAGTSTGGILSCIYLTPNKDGRPKFTAQEAVDLYLEKGNKIFDVGLWHKLRSGLSVTDEKYEADALEDSLKDYLGNLKLSELLKPCLITSYDIFRRKAQFFNKADAVDNPVKDFLVRDIARATSAAPTYFETANIKSVYGTPYYLIDGGVFANNPAMCAYAEARTLDFDSVLHHPGKMDKPMAKNMLMLSIGTGSKGDPYNYNQAKDWGLAGWILPLIDILMSGNSETVNYQLQKMFATITLPDHSDYYRLEPERAPAAAAMDNASPVNMLALKEAGMRFVSENEEKLEYIVEQLIANK
ncbi:MAG: patatin-like phospholipase family protein [Bacteroidales bacterium]|nr:patatin-like phospholipase family protein [Bacteroidales bacterium]